MPTPPRQVRLGRQHYDQDGLKDPMEGHPFLYPGHKRPENTVKPGFMLNLRGTRTKRTQRIRLTRSSGRPDDDFRNVSRIPLDNAKTRMDAMERYATFYA